MEEEAGEEAVREISGLWVGPGIIRMYNVTIMAIGSRPLSIHVLSTLRCVLLFLAREREKESEFS